MEGLSFTYVSDCQRIKSLIERRQRFGMGRLPAFVSVWSLALIGNASATSLVLSLCICSEAFSIRRREGSR